MWQPTDGAWRSGRYEILPDRPSGWRLYVSGRPAGHFARASSARMAAARVERRRRRRHRLAARGALIAALVAVIAVLGATRMTDNPARRDAAALAAEIETAHTAIRAGAPPASVVSSRVDAAIVDIPRGDPVVMISGEAAGRCYVMYWNERRGPVARWLVDGLPCRPDAAAATSAHNVYHAQTPAAAGHLPWFNDAFDFDDILPPEQRQQPWTLPAMLAAATAALIATVDATKLMLGVEPADRRRSQKTAAGAAATA
jgi:hypothetical protein